MDGLRKLLERLFGSSRAETEPLIIEARDLTCRARELQDRLRPYAEASDPMAALMTDVFEHRRARARMRHQAGA